MPFYEKGNKFLNLDYSTLPSEPRLVGVHSASDPKRPAVLKYELKPDGTTGNGAVFFDAAPRAALKLPGGPPKEAADCPFGCRGPVQRRPRAGERPERGQALYDAGDVVHRVRPRQARVRRRPERVAATTSRPGSRPGTSSRATG